MNYRQAKKKFLKEHGFNPRQITWRLKSDHFEKAMDSVCEEVRKVADYNMEVINAILEIVGKLGQWIH